MENQPYYGTLRTNPRFLIGAAIFVTLAVAIILFAVVRSTTRATDLLPVLATPTAAQNGSDALSPITVTFRELNSNPIAYLNLPIQVSGSYMALDPPSCPRFSGPPIQWALVSEDLQLAVKGFERVVRILEPGTDMTVQGIWRLYQGPLGCGKGPPSGSTWYLQAQRIVQPNPLVGDGSAGPIDIEGVDQGLPDLLPTDGATSTPAPTQLMETPVATATINQTGPPLTIEPTGTADGVVGVTPSLTPSFSTNTPGPGGNTPGPTPTAGATATTGSGGDENDPTATPQTPLAPTATQPPGGYPGLGTAEPTPNPYP
jgi:hypothetical protein